MSYVSVGSDIRGTRGCWSWTDGHVLYTLPPLALSNHVIFSGSPTVKSAWTTLLSTVIPQIDAPYYFSTGSFTNNTRWLQLEQHHRDVCRHYLYCPLCIYTVVEYVVQHCVHYGNHSERESSHEGVCLPGYVWVNLRNRCTLRTEALFP